MSDKKPWWKRLWDWWKNLDERTPQLPVLLQMSTDRLKEYYVNLRRDVRYRSWVLDYAKGELRRRGIDPESLD